VGSPVIVVLAPHLHDPAGIAQAQEPVLGEAFVPEVPVEALRVRVLDRLARIDEPQGDPALVRPLIEHFARQLGSIVEHDRAGTPARGHHPFQHLRHPHPGEAGVDLDRERFPRGGIDHHQHPDPATRRQRIAHDVERPLLVRSARSRRSAALERHPFPTTPADRQAISPVEPFDPLVVDHDPLPA